MPLDFFGRHPVPEGVQQDDFHSVHAGTNDVEHLYTVYFQSTSFFLRTWGNCSLYIFVLKFFCILFSKCQH